MKEFSFRKGYVLLILSLAFLLGLPLWASQYLIHTMIMILFFAYLSSCWNILGGYAGQISFGHHVFVGIGAYTSAVLYVKMGLTPWLGMLVGGLFGTSLGIFISFLSFRYNVREIYFALITLAFAEGIKLLSLNLRFIEGTKGLHIPLKNSLVAFQFSRKTPYYFIILGMLIIITVVVFYLDRSKIGIYLKSIREDEEAADALGINIFKYKVIAMGISAFFTSLGGTFISQFTTYLHPDVTFSMEYMVGMLLGTIVGGIGTIWGPILGTFIVTTTSELLTFVPITGEKAVNIASFVIIVFGLILIFLMIFMPRGILGLIKARQKIK